VSEITANPAAERVIRIELARRNFWEFCKVRLPKIYKEEKPWLKDLCTSMQDFWQQDEIRIMVVTLPPRHFKSLTGQLFTEWVLGQSIENRAITGSYNERLATLFARRVRDTIRTPIGQSQKIEYGEIFPNTRISKKDAAADIWSLEGSPVPSYLATSPGGTAVGIGANLMFFDDLVKNADEAYSDTAMESVASWVFDTMMSRLEGDWKIIVIMQRWSTKDIAGRFLSDYECVHVNYPAYTKDDDGMHFLCPEQLNEKSWRAKTVNMSPHIERAIYLQDPVDIQGRLYKEFNTYSPKEVVPSPSEYVYSVTDTADRGKDFLCTGIYIERDGIVYLLDYYLSDSPMEITEVQVAQKFDRWNVRVAFTESNNGGRLFARNVRRLMKNKSCVFIDKMSTSNKEARILQSSGWVQNYVWFPEGWKSMWSDLHNQIMEYNAKGDNAHDDAVDMLCFIYMMCTQQGMGTQERYEGESAFSPVTQEFNIGSFFSSPSDSEYSQEQQHYETFWKEY
jgi:predicted phage terminase large subunit-like protein